ncbi:hypothetical protein C8R43DRAFT_368845 [Mycena crocata]|nr:hypothetical protein C8R43DRAFT_368845 [Mycena crocata]
MKQKTRAKGMKEVADKLRMEPDPVRKDIAFACQPHPSTLSRTTTRPAYPRQYRSPLLSTPLPLSTMSFIKFGNHRIAPAGFEPAPTESSPTSEATEVLRLARLLCSKIKDLETTTIERRARRQELRTAVSRLDKNLMALREEDRKEGEKLARLIKRHNRTAFNGATICHNIESAFPTRDLSRYPSNIAVRNFVEEGRFACPTTQAASAFIGSNERLRDSYTFSGTGWQDAPDVGSQFSSPATSSSAYHMDERNSFHFTMSPEELDTGRDVENWSAATTPTKHGNQASRRLAFSDVQNTSQAIGEGNGRKRKSAEFEAEEDAPDGPYKKARAGEPKRYNPKRKDSRGSWRNWKRSEMNC